MAYLRIQYGTKDLGCRTLDGPLVLGRQNQCELSLVDVRLSRAHCRFELTADGWAVVDLSSKNGTWLDSQRVERAILRDASVVRAGGTSVVYHDGDIPADAPAFRKRTRPIDPHAAMEATMSGVVVAAAAHRPTDPWEAARATNAPRPNPLRRHGAVGLLELPARSGARALPHPIVHELTLPHPALANLPLMARPARRRQVPLGLWVFAGLTFVLSLVSFAVAGLMKLV